MSGKKCPSDEQLLGFSIGKAAPQVIDEVAEHLESCATCSKRIERIESGGNDLLSRLRRQVTFVVGTGDQISVDRLQHADLIKSQSAAVDPIGEKKSEETIRGSAPGSTLRIRCPYCQVLVEASDRRSMSDLTCDACGSAFSLVEDSRETRSAPIRRSWRNLIWSNDSALELSVKFGRPEIAGSTGRSPSRFPVRDSSTRTKRKSSCERRGLLRS